MSTFLCFFLSLLFFSGSFERLNITSKFRRVGPSCLHSTELGIFTCAHTHTHTHTHSTLSHTHTHHISTQVTGPHTHTQHTGTERFTAVYSQKVAHMTSDFLNPTPGDPVHG